MKCLLLLLASGLISSEKLDRSYLPPPGAKYSGGTLDDLHLPLEVPKETYKEVIQNGLLAGYYPKKTFTGLPTNQDLNNGLSIIPNDYSTASIVPNDISQTTQFSPNRYQPTIPTSSPVSNLFNTFPSTLPSSNYLPTKPTNVGVQSYSAPNVSPGFQSFSTANNLRPSADRKDTGYYYVPTIQTYKNGITNQRLNDGSPLFGLIQFPNRGNNAGLFGNTNSYIPTTTTTDDIVQNYQPGAFGFYGGNPMIMTAPNSLPQGFRNMELTSKFGDNVNNVPMSINQGKLKDNKKSYIRPFQTPLVRPNSKNPLESTYLKPTAPNNNFPSQSTTNKSFLKEYDQKNGIPGRSTSRFRQERPQTELERNAVIINYENSISPDGYSFSYDTSNGIHADESGIATNGVRAKGSYSYTGDDGKIYTVTYTADENGFQPKGDHLPTAPPIPEAIQKIIDQAGRDRTAGIIDDGFYDEKKYGYMNYQGAMDSYNNFKNNNSKNQRLDASTRKQNGSLGNKNRNEFASAPSYSNNDSKTNKQTYKSLNDLQNLRNNNANKMLSQINEINDKNTLDTRRRSNFGEQNQNNNKFNKQSRKPITSVTDNQVENEDRVMFQNKILGVIYKPTNANVDITNTNTQDQISQTETPGANSGVTLTHDGYYYVPPVIKFNSNTENPILKKNTYLETNKPIPKINATEAIKRTGYDEPQRQKSVDEESVTTQVPFNLNTVATEPTRKPYISGPDDRDKTTYDINDSQSNISIQGDTYNPEENLNNRGSSLYGLNTTPMATSTIQESQPPAEFSQYYQSTTNPTVFDQIVPKTIENRVNIPLRNKGISVSQDFVTTTYRPFISSDGVLEVNQNVKIYGIGIPETTATSNGYVYPVPENNNDLLYSTSVPNGESTIAGVYPDNFYTEPVRDNTVFQGIPNENLPYGNEYFTTGVPRSDINFDGISQGGPITVPNVQNFNANTFGNPDFSPTQDVTIPTIATPTLGPGRIIGEDFSGPKQPQKFDPETGYYYK